MEGGGSFLVLAGNGGGHFVLEASRKPNTKHASGSEREELAQVSGPLCRASGEVQGSAGRCRTRGETAPPLAGAKGAGQHRDPWARSSRSSRHIGTTIKASDC